MSLRTYSHLQKLGRKPNDYDIGSSDLLYYLERGFEVRHPMAAWYQAHQKGSPLQAPDWERFLDPRATTYASYTALQDEREVFVAGLHHSIEDTDYDASLDPAWLRLLEPVLGPLRYPVHGLQMVAAYVGSMAPGGRLAIACLFQTGDELRRVHHLAYRLRQLQLAHPGFGEASRASWQEDPRWQPLREVVERLLVTYDWGEAFVALNLVLKPRFDALYLVHFAHLARQFEDDLLAKIFFSLSEDFQWHLAWSRALVQVALEERAENREVIEGWLQRWDPRVEGAIARLAEVFDEPGERFPDCGSAEVLATIAAEGRAFRTSMGLSAGEGSHA